MFSEQRWNILRCLSQDSYSPMQLAQMLDTTMANICQQLRLLEAANLVKKQKIKNRDKGKPRTLFSLTEDCAYLIPTMHDFADKKLLKVTDHHKITLKIWFLENPELHPYIEKFYWGIEQYLNQVQLFAVNQATKELLIVSNARDEIEKIASKMKGICTKILSTEEADKAAKQGKGPFASISQFSIILDRSNAASKKTARGAA